MSNREKELYNTYIAVSRSLRDKPFRLRQNFEDFENNPDYIYIKKIEYFLRQFPQIKIKHFFSAPYVLYKDVEYFDLKFFATQRAVKAYTVYMNQLQEESPDSDHHIQFIKDSLRFIGMFCIKNKIPLNEYIHHSSGVTYSWMKHVKERSITIYSVFEFPEVFSIIRKCPKDEVDLFLGTLITGLSGYKNDFDKSKNARRIVKEGLKRIKRVVDESINTRV